MTLSRVTLTMVMLSKTMHSQIILVINTLSKIMLSRTTLMRMTLSIKMHPVITTISILILCLMTLSIMTKA